MSKSGPVQVQDSPTTRSVSRHRVTPTTLSSDRVGPIVTSREPIAIRPPAPPRTMSSPSPPPTTQSPSPGTSATTSPTRPTDIEDQAMIEVSDIRNSLPRVSRPADVHEAAVHRADTDDQKLELWNTDKRKNTSDLFNPNNNFSYLTSTPNNRTVNGNLSDFSLNATISNNDMKIDNVSPIMNYKEQMLNNINATNNRNGVTTTIIADIEGEVKRKHRFIDKGYYMAKEILMTEITYKKDLDVINIWFREEVGSKVPEVCYSLLSLIKPLAEAHDLLLKDLEQRIQGWDGRGGPKATQGKIADVLLTHLPPLIPLYQEYIDEHIKVLENLDDSFKHNAKFAQIYREFESQKVCYRPFTFFVLKPLHRLIQYRAMLNRFLKHYSLMHPDRADAVTVANCLNALIDPVPEILEESGNIAILCELQKDIVGYDHLFLVDRKFIRHGCLLKLSDSGYQQRMFFLFSDILLETTRCQATLQFVVHGHMFVRDLKIEEQDGELGNYGFIIIEDDSNFAVAANSFEEKEQWRLDLERAIQSAKERDDVKQTCPSLKGSYSSDDMIDQCGNNVGTQTKLMTQRSNTTVHVCWHRSTSIGVKDELIAVENQLSGFLLRKFKRSNGWQKLWVVFANFCLFFYKGCKDEFPLASLPLLGYSVGPPSSEDTIHKDFVFKLQYKNHIYFFRAESEYTYNRWLEVINCITQANVRKRIKQLDNTDSIKKSPEQ